MLASALIVFREVIEAGLIIGIVLAATQKVQGRLKFIVCGVLGGVLGASLLAVFAGSISSALSGIGQEVFNATVLGLAVLMLAWHNIWMAQHGREMAMEMRSMGEAVSSGSQSLAALGVVVGIAVLREGSEIVLFLYSIVISDGNIWNLVIGSSLGLMGGGLISFMTYRGLVTIPMRYLFSVTGIMIAFLAAGMAAQCVSFLEKANAIDVLSSPIWDTSEILSVTSIAGRILHTLVGYDDQPSYLQAMVYVIVLISIFSLMQIFKPQRKVVPNKTYTIDGNQAPFASQGRS